MKQYHSLKKLLSLAATTALFSLVAPVHAQDSAAQDNAAADAEAAAPAEQGEAQQSPDAEATDGEDAAEASGDQPADQAGAEAEEGAAAEGQDGEEQSEEQVDPTASLRGITWEKRIEAVDADDSSTVEESELAQAYQPELEEAGWGPDEAVNRFDRDQDGRLGPTEYLFFMSGLQQQLTGGDEREQQAQR